MGIRFLNTDVQCFKKANGEHFETILREVPAIKIDDNFYIGKFFMAVFINGRGDVGKMDFKIRMTKLENDPKKQISQDLKDFTIKFPSDNIIVDQVDLISVEQIEIPKKGLYAIKVLVKKTDEEKYKTNSLNILKVV